MVSGKSTIPTSKSTPVSRGQNPISPGAADAAGAGEGGGRLRAGGRHGAAAVAGDRHWQLGLRRLRALEHGGSPWVYIVPLKRLKGGTQNGWVYKGKS